MKMISIKLYAALVGAGFLLRAPLLQGADITFLLTFDGKTLSANHASGLRKPIKEIATDDSNFIPGFNKGTAFVRTKEEYPSYDLSRNLNLPEGTISFWFKPIKWDQDKPARFLHLYSPSKDEKDHIIFYFFKKKGSNDIVVRIYTHTPDDIKKDVVLTISGDSVKEDAWQKVDLTWDEKNTALYHNGEKMDEKPMSDSFAELSRTARGYGSLAVLPVFTSDGDDWGPQTAMGGVTIYNAPLSAAEVKESYGSDAGASK